jgi:hypothetical protein
LIVEGERSTKLKLCSNGEEREKKRAASLGKKGFLFIVPLSDL